MRSVFSTEQLKDFLNPSGLCEAEGITAIHIGGQRKMVIVYDSKEENIYRIIPFPPQAEDQDANGVPDWQDALPAGTDTDGDRLPNGLELLRGTRIFVRDNDAGGEALRSTAPESGAHTAQMTKD